MAEEFYNTFYNAFTSESSERRTEMREVSKEISENLKFENMYGSQQKPPKLMKVEDYNWWKNRFEGWVKAFAPESWLKLVTEYQAPEKAGGELIEEKDYTEKDVKNVVAEYRMITLIKQSVREDIISLLEQEKTSKKLWEALERKCIGSNEIVKNKKKLLRREFDLFSCMKNESVCSMLERFGHLKMELTRHGISYDEDLMVDKLFDSLPNDQEWQYFALMLKNTIKPEELKIDLLIERLESHELELKRSKVNIPSHQQNVELYYRSHIPQAGSPKTAFSAESSNTVNNENLHSGFHSGASSNTSDQTASKNVFQCNIVIDLKNGQNFSEESAKQQMVFLASVLEAYEGLVAGKIGNTNLTKEEYDQIDPEEMELMDIRWCMASAVRRAQRFMEITGRKSIGGPSTKLGFDKSKVTCFKCKQKGHFKRECRNSYVAEASENPFNEDYYKKAIYHQNKSEPPRLKQQEEKSRALVVIYDDEGYDWSKEVLPEQDAVGYAFVAKDDHDTWWRKDSARWEIGKLYEPFHEAQRAKRWNEELECYLDPQGNPVVDPSKVDFDAVTNVFPSERVFNTKRLSDSSYLPELMNKLREVFETSLPKVVEMKKRKEEELKKMIEEVKTVAKLAGEENQKDMEENVEKIQETQAADHVKVPITEVTEFSELPDVDLVVEKENKCRNCIEKCKACIEKEEIIKTKDNEMNKLEHVLKLKCRERIDTEQSLKLKVEKLTQKCHDFEKENTVLKEKCDTKCVDCIEKESKFLELQKQYDSLKLSSQKVQEAYDTLKSQVKSFDQRLSETLTTKEIYERQFKEKQIELNKRVDEIANLKQVLAEKEKIVTKLQSYHDSSYILERIFNITPDNKDTNVCNKGIGSEYHQVPPPLRDSYTFYDEEKVAKGLNIADQLPDSIDVTYTKSDDADDSEVVSKVVDSVLKDESTKGKSESQDEDEGNLYDGYLKDTKSEKNLNDDSKGLVYTMIGSDKLFLDVVFPIQNVISEKIDKVFKMVEIEKSEMSKFAGKGFKGSYNKPGFKKKNMKSGLGYRKKHNRNRTERSNFQTKMNFVQGKSFTEEEKLKLGTQSNAEFEAMKKKQQQPKDVSKKVCFKCDQIGHVARKCQIPKSVDVQKQKSGNEKPRSTRFDSRQTWRYTTNKFASNQIWKPKSDRFDSRQTWNSHTSGSTTTQIWRPIVVVTEPRKIWKPKNVVQKQQVQKETNFYKRGAPEGQKWSVKKRVDEIKTENVEKKSEKQTQIWKPKAETKGSTSEVKTSEDSVLVAYDANFPPLKAENFKIQIARIKVLYADEDCENVAWKEIEDPWFWSDREFVFT
ncbi:putative transcription factor interactor and regulator CCHC(Zn) family [Helianthus annuus]|nr:putative transcription factor interactor and regulator CCHC(Zn) family [Helianthus annuus]KAJ0825124.1 putative transcription factor interactor and regulator CCHC(Zn) family [Helianthus annuus]